MTTAILALNAGSSSIKFALCRRDQALQRQRRCGFHGLSCAALIQELARIGGADAAYAGLISRPASSSTVRVMRTNKKNVSRERTCA